MQQLRCSKRRYVCRIITVTKVKERGCPHSDAWLTHYCPDAASIASLLLYSWLFPMLTHSHPEKARSRAGPQENGGQAVVLFLEVGRCRLLHDTFLSRYTMGISLGPCCVSVELGRNPRRATCVLKKCTMQWKTVSELVLPIWAPTQRRLRDRKNLLWVHPAAFWARQ